MKALKDEILQDTGSDEGNALMCLIVIVELHLKYVKKISAYIDFSIYIEDYLFQRYSKGGIVVVAKYWKCNRNINDKPHILFKI